MVEVYANPLCLRYHAPRCSFSYWIWFILTVLEIVLPFFLAYPNDFWRKEAVYSEQPLVTFMNQVAVQVEDNSGNLLAWSTMSTFNDVVQFGGRAAPSVRSFTEDVNSDGIPDAVDLTLTVPKARTEQFVSVKLLTWFNMKLRDRVDMENSGFVYLERQSSLPLSSWQVHMHIFGSTHSICHFTASSPLLMRNRLVRPRTQSLIEVAACCVYASAPVSAVNFTDIESTRFDRILANYALRNETLRVDGMENSIWVGGGQAVTENTVHLHLTIPPLQIRYIPGLGEVLKWAWVQYLAVFLILYWLLEKVVFPFLFKYQILRTNPLSDIMPANRQHQF